MATITPGLFTYTEWAQRMDPDGKISQLVNLLSQQNSILQDMMGAECQSGNVFEYTQVVKLPTPSRRSYNQGWVRTLAAVNKQVTTCVEYADWATIDDSLVRLGGNAAELRAQEDFLHMEGLNQQIASDLFYSNRATDPTAFTGLANVYNTVNASTSKIAANVIDCGGTGSDNASMWLVVWGPKHIHTIFPKGLPAGMQHIDMGRLPITDAGGVNEFIAWRTALKWNIGLAIHDWRFCVRACNIDVSDLATGSAANLLNTLALMVMKPPVMPAGVSPVQTADDPRVVMGRPVFYVNRTVYTALQKQVTNKTNILLRLEQWAGMTILTYQGVPIRIVDALLTSESRVV